MNNLVVRSLSGVVYVAVFVTCILLGANWFYFLNEFLIIAATIEFLRLTEKRLGEKISAWVYIGVCLFAFVLSTGFSFLSDPLELLSGAGSPGLNLILMGLGMLVSFILIWVAILCSCVVSKKPGILDTLGQSLLSLIYITLPLSLLYLVYGSLPYGHGRIIILAALIGIWLNDTGAYCVGCTIGKHRLCERLSPKKSWEGFYGGLFVTVVGAVIYALTMHYNVLIWAVFGILISVLATFGDLFESMIKRNAGVKDSGRMIPGHGGILDRIDSLLFVSYAVVIMNHLLTL